MLRQFSWISGKCIGPPDALFSFSNPDLSEEYLHLTSNSQLDPCAAYPSLPISQSQCCKDAIFTDQIYFASSNFVVSADSNFDDLSLHSQTFPKSAALMKYCKISNSSLFDFDAALILADGKCKKSFVCNSTTNTLTHYSDIKCTTDPGLVDHSILTVSSNASTITFIWTANYPFPQYASYMHPNAWVIFTEICRFSALLVTLIYAINAIKSFHLRQNKIRALLLLCYITWYFHGMTNLLWYWVSSKAPYYDGLMYTLYNISREVGVVAVVFFHLTSLTKLVFQKYYTYHIFVVAAILQIIPAVFTIGIAIVSLLENTGTTVDTTVYDFFYQADQTVNSIETVGVFSLGSITAIIVNGYILKTKNKLTDKTIRNMIIIVLKDRIVQVTVLLQIFLLSFYLVTLQIATNSLIFGDDISTDAVYPLHYSIWVCHVVLTTWSFEQFKSALKSRTSNSKVLKPKKPALTKVAKSILAEDGSNGVKTPQPPEDSNHANTVKITSAGIKAPDR